jgi:hypothetical protein
MASQFDESDFVDRDYESTQSGYPSNTGHAGVRMAQRPPTREELDARVADAQQRLLELRRAQEELERERTALEDARRRRVEFQTGRAEMVQNLTRGITVLEQAEFAARRNSEQMAKTLSGLRESLAQIQAVREEEWNQDNWNAELAKALATVENGRMEWNAARLKWTLLDGQPHGAAATETLGPSADAGWVRLPFWEQCKLGLALTWPIAALGLIALVVALVALFR